MQRPKCIFCLTTNEREFNIKEHIIPESLGSGDWAMLLGGLFCDKCENTFGSSIEQQALGVYPLSNFRTFFGIPTKKRKAPWFSFWEGRLFSRGEVGKIIYEPNGIFKNSFESGQKILSIIPWDYNFRKIYEEVATFKEPTYSLETGEVNRVQTIHEYDFLYIENKYLYFTCAIMGIQYTIGIGDKPLDIYSMAERA